MTKMRNNSAFLCLCLLFLAVLSARAAVVSTSGRKLLVDGTPFTIKGFCYSPVPAGSPNTYAWWSDASLYENDFSLLKKMGVNTIRTYHAPQITAGFLDAAAQKGIHVIMGFYVDPAKVGTAAEAAMIEDFIAMVQAWKAHPAVLMWMFGNEVDAQAASKADWYTLLSSACVRAHAADPAHPTGTANQDIEEIGDAAVKADTATLSAVDIWGINVYRGSSFGNVFAVMSQNSTTDKPYFFSEWGCDAYNSAAGAEDERLQSSYIKSQWAEIAANLAVDGKTCSGGTAFEWTDEWWKGDSVAGNPFTIGLGGVNGIGVQDTPADWTNALYEDPGMQEEWWGIVAIAPNTVTRRFRLAYYTLQDAWYVPGAGDTVNGSINPAIIFQGDVHSFPNPFRAGIDVASIKIIVSGSPDITAEIFDLSGRKVCALSDIFASGTTRIIQWRGIDSDNNAVDAGLYICKITAKIEGREETKFRKIVVAK